MKRSGSLLVAALATLLALPLAAQNEIDVYRFSGGQVTGTARAVGVGGAFSAVGADFTSAWLNPAGLGLYKRSEFELTPSLHLNNNEWRYMGVDGSTSASRFGFSNVGYVISGVGNTSGTPGKIKNWSIGIGYQQKSNYRRNTDLSVYNTENSITDYFAADAQGTNYQDIEAGYSPTSLAWWAVLIDTLNSLTNYQPAVVGGNVQQNLRIEETGRSNQWAVSVAGNVDDRLYMGVTLGISDLRYLHDMRYTEEDINDVHRAWTTDSTPFNSLTYTDYYLTKGTGIDARLGVIYRPTDFLRLAASIQSPTWHSMKDRYLYEITARFDGSADTFGDDEVQGYYNYNLVTPFRATLGAAFIYKKAGFLSADLDIIDYSTARLSGGSPSSDNYYSFSTENKAVSDLYGMAYNARIGAELRLDIFRLRGGFATYSPQLKPEYRGYVDYPNGNTVDFRAGRNTVTGGVGIKQESFYLDLAFAHETTAERQLFYTVKDPTEYSPELYNKLISNRFLMTIGFTF
jgi:hypothetical protein